MTQTVEQLVAAIAAIDGQRGLLGDAVADTALAPLRAALEALRGAAAQTKQQPQPQPQQQQQLKQATVLFVDVVGSTAIGQQLDPEQIHAVMDGALERFTAAVQAHRGRVLQYTGDGMLAAFGTESAHEDDVESAVLAGLAILDAARLLAPAMRTDHGVADFDVRAGIHTGRVLLGGGVDAAGSIRGATVNLAARMEQSAPPGRLRISHASYRHVRGLFELQEQPPVLVKGLAQPQRSYLVGRALPRVFRSPTRGIDGVSPAMVGRDAELDRLLDAYGQVVDGGQLRAVTVVGDAGLGKSRLVSEFQQRLHGHAQPCWLLPGRAVPRSALRPFSLLRDLLGWQLQLDDGDSAEAARAKFCSGMAPLLADLGEAPLHCLGHLIGLDFSASPLLQDLLGDDRQWRAIALDAAAQALRRLGQRRNWPVVLLLDDLHWADTGSLSFVSHLLASHRDMPLLCVMLTRPSLFESGPGAWTAEAALAEPSAAAMHHQRIDLQPLDRSGSRTLADALLQRIAEVPAALRALVTGGAEGNPFYMEELVKMLIDDGVIVVDDEGWRVLPQALVQARVPPTLAGVLQARLDALSPAERHALQQAAVVGHQFGDQVLAAVDAAAMTELPTLLQRRLLVRHGGRPVGAATDALAGAPQQYSFAHQLLHQVTYDSLLKEPRRLAHGRAGAHWRALAEVDSPIAVSPASCRALAEAHDHLRLADAAAYIRWFDGQFSCYLNAYASQTLRPLAEVVVETSRAQHGDQHASTARARTNLARVMLVQGDVQQAEPVLRQAIASQEAAGGDDQPDIALSLSVLGACHAGRGELAAAEPLFRRALAIRERTLGLDHALTLSTLDYLASIVGESGRPDEAEALSRRVLASRERLLGADHVDTAQATTALADLLVKQGRFGQAEPLLRAALATQQRQLSADHPNTGLTLWTLAEALCGLGRAGEAEPLARRTLEIWHAAFGAEHQWMAWGLGTLAQLRLAQGDAVEAVQLATQALQIHQRCLGDRHPTVAQTLVLLAQALVAGADPAAARPLLERAAAIQAERLSPDDAARRDTAAALAALGSVAATA